MPADVQWNTTNGPGPYPYRANFTILERVEDAIPRSRSVGSAASDTMPRSNPPILEDVAHKRVKSHSDSHDSSSDSGYADPGYADPVDAVREYLASQGRNGGNVVVTEPPYQTLEEIQRARLMRILPQEQRDAEGGGGGGEEPTYSRPFDCLLGLSNPVRVTSVSSQQHLSVFPLAFRRTASPDGPISSGRAVRKKHRLSRQLPPASSGSDDTLSSFSSPEPAEEGSLLSGRRSNSLGCLLEPEEVGRPRSKPAASPVKGRHLRERVNSENNLLVDRSSLGSSPDLGRRTTCSTAVSCSQIRAGQTPSPIASSSPPHIPVPARVTRLENGQARLISSASLDSQ